MTSPYITFEEMEEGKVYRALCVGTDEFSAYAYKREGEHLLFQASKLRDEWVIDVGGDPYQLIFIPVYSPPKRWEKYVDFDGDFRVSSKSGITWFSADAKKGANVNELQAAIDWLQDELDRRQKAGES